jgi:hypothetical protein
MASHQRNSTPLPRIVLALIPLLLGTVAGACDNSSKPNPGGMGGMTSLDNGQGLPGLLGGLKPMMSTTPMPPPPMMSTSGTELTCAGFIQCADACDDSDDACYQACMNRTSSMGRAQFDAIVACSKTNKCAGVTGCLQAKCAAVVSTCLGVTVQPPPPPPPPPATLTCGGIIKCVNACKDGDNPCVEACITNGSAKGKADLDALITCGNTNMCKGVSGCLQQKCAAQFAACSDGATPPPPPPPPPPGNLTCGGIVTCWSACKDGDEPCLEACLEKGSAKGKADLDALITCGNTNMCKGVSGCLQQKCGPQLAACATGTTPPPPPPPTQLTCAGVFQCWDACADDDDACAQACINKASTKGRADLDALVACGNANMCPSVPGCLQQKCAPQLAACGK